MVKGVRKTSCLGPPFLNAGVSVPVLRPRFVRGGLQCLTSRVSFSRVTGEGSESRGGETGNSEMCGTSSQGSPVFVGRCVRWWTVTVGPSPTTSTVHPPVHPGVRSIWTGGSVTSRPTSPLSEPSDSVFPFSYVGVVRPTGSTGGTSRVPQTTSGTRSGGPGCTWYSRDEPSARTYIPNRSFHRPCLIRELRVERELTYLPAEHPVLFEKVLRLGHRHRPKS